MTLIFTSFEKDIAAKCLNVCKLDAKSDIYKEKGSEEALVSVGSETLLKSVTELGWCRRDSVARI